MQISYTNYIQKFMELGDSQRPQDREGQKQREKKTQNSKIKKKRVLQIRYTR